MFVTKRHCAYTLNSMSQTVEIEQLEQLVLKAKDIARVKSLGKVKARDREFDIYGIEMGSEDPTAPTLVLTAGVHGLERVGSHVLFHFLLPLLEQLEWDQDLQNVFKRIRVATIPIVNPGGMYMLSRCNPNGVDIMRNGRFEGDEKGSYLVSGHRKSPRLPWYRGAEGAEQEIETRALIDFVRKNTSQSRCAFSLDIHSGFGMRDRLWYPWSGSKKEIPDLEFMMKFKKLLRSTHPFHFYKVENQTSSYVIHGDPWDELYAEHLKSRNDQVYVPLALEMGSWTWLKKNPGQFFRVDGLYNPIITHRYNRIMRRHRPLLDFFIRAVANHENWRQN